DGERLARRERRAGSGERAGCGGGAHELATAPSMPCGHGGSPFHPCLPCFPPARGGRAVPESIPSRAAADLTDADMRLTASVDEAARRDPASRRPPSSPCRKTSISWCAALP